MYCSKCGEKLEEGTNFCKNCNGVLEESKSNTTTKSNKVISIIGLVFSFIIPIVGLILSIIGLSKGNKISKETGEKNKYIALNVIGIVSSIIIFIISTIIIFVVLVFVIINVSFPKPDGKWECGGYTSYINPAVSLDLNKNKTFTWAKYGSESNNYIKGSYSYNSIESSGSNLSNYSINMYVTHAVIEGKSTDLNNETITGRIIMDSSNSNIMKIYISNSRKTYYCKKIN